MKTACTIILLTALLGTPAFAADNGPGIDPNGIGSAIDPNGDGGPCIDPNGIMPASAECALISCDAAAGTCLWSCPDTNTGPGDSCEGAGGCSNGICECEIGRPPA